MYNLQNHQKDSGLQTPNICRVQCEISIKVHANFDWDSHFYPRKKGHMYFNPSYHRILCHILHVPHLLYLWCSYSVQNLILESCKQDRTLEHAHAILITIMILPLRSKEVCEPHDYSSECCGMMTLALTLWRLSLHQKMLFPQTLVSQRSLRKHFRRPPRPSVLFPHRPISCYLSANPTRN